MKCVDISVRILNQNEIKSIKKKEKNIDFIYINFNIHITLYEHIIGYLL